MNKSANMGALVRVLTSRQPYTGTYTVLRRLQEDTPDNIWLDIIEDKSLATSTISATHFKVLPVAGQKFKMTTIGCNIMSVEV